MTTTENITPEFSVEIDLNTLGRVGKFFRLAADEKECSKVAGRLGVIKLENLAGEFRLTASKTEIDAAGAVRASLVRECVASLEPMIEIVDEKFEIKFTRVACADAAEEETEDWDRPELHVGEVFDVGELLVQQLSLAMDPFPRRDAASGLAERYGQSELDSPFSELRGALEKDQKKQ